MVRHRGLVDRLGPFLGKGVGLLVGAQGQTVSGCVSKCMHPLACSGLDKCVRQNAAMAQTSKEKQEAFRARQAMLGFKEVRGIYLPEELHAAIKEEARKMLERHQKEKP